MEPKKIEKSISIRFPLDIIDDIKDLAQEDERSFNGEVVWIVRQYIQERRKAHENDSQSPQDKA